MMYECSNNGVCVDSLCQCYSGYTGKQDFIDLTGYDCATQILPRQILFMISIAAEGVLFFYASYVLYTLWPIRLPPTPKQKALLCIVFMNAVWITFAGLILAGDLWVTEELYLVILFVLNWIGMYFFITSKALLLIKVALASQSVSASLENGVNRILWTGTLVFAAILSVLILATWGVSDFVAKDGLVIGWGLLNWSICVGYVVTIAIYGNKIIRVLSEGMDQTPTIKEAILKLKIMRNQNVIALSNVSVLWLFFSTFPFLRAVIMQMIIATMTFFATSNIPFVYSVTKSSDQGYAYRNSESNFSKSQTKELGSNQDSGRDSITIDLSVSKDSM